jgi:glycosyltransferase 2 family protein
VTESAPPGTRSRWLSRLHRWGRPLAILVVIVSVGWMVHGIDPSALGAAVARASLWPILAATVINFGIIACKAGAWQLLLAPRYPVPLLRLCGYTVTSYAASSILPMRAGEVIRLWLLRDREGVPMVQSAAVAVAEKLLDIVAILIVVAPIPWLVPNLPAWLSWWLAGLSAATVVLLLVLRHVTARTVAEADDVDPNLAGGSWVRRFVQGLRPVHQPRIFAAVLGLLVLGTVIDLVDIALVLWAVGVPLSIGTAVLVLFTVNVTIAVPSTPGQLGALELGAMVALRLVHAPQAESLAFAVIYHALQVIPLVAVSLLLHARVLLRGLGASRE